MIVIALLYKLSVTLGIAGIIIRQQSQITVINHALAGKV